MHHRHRAVTAMHCNPGDNL